jgi:membrane protease YdiL (CAAX protease family)
LGSVLLVLSFISLVYVRNGENRMTLGLGTKYLKPAGFYCICVTVGMAVGLGFWGYLAGTLRWEVALVQRIFWYFFWAAFQQLFFQIFFTTQFKKVIPNKMGVALCSALVFALIHLPNFLLMGATFVSGFCWALIYCRYPNLFSIALSHATLAVLLKFSLSNVLTCGLRIGPGC